MTLTWLADVLRADGLKVVEYPNWKTHDRDGSWSPTYGVVHATAAPRSQLDSVQIRVVRDGRSDLPGPIANAVVDRKGVWHVVGGGRCNSTLVGTAGPFKGLGNTNALSVEGCNDNLTEPWPAVQYDAYVRGWAAWCRRLGWTAAKLVGHKEHTPGRKTDPTFSMTTFRADVARAIAGGGDDMSTEAEAQVAELRKELLDPAKGYTFNGKLDDTLSRLRDSSFAVVAGNPVTWLGKTLARVEAAQGTLAAKLDALAADGDRDVLAKIDQRHQDTLQRLADIEEREQARDAENLAAFRDALPDGTDPVTREELEAALTAVFGHAFGQAQA